MGTEADTDPNTGKQIKVRRQVRRAVLFTADEGQVLGEIGNRKGSTLNTSIRSAWVGAQLGQANASEDRTRRIPAHEYRFALVTAFQRETATALMDDVAGGTPQRFLFASGIDAAIPDDAPKWPGSIEWQPPTHTAEPMGLATEIHDEIRSHNLAVSRGHTTPDPLDSHRNLGRLKVAALLALVEGRFSIEADDWNIAGEILDASDRVRARILDEARRRNAETERSYTAKMIGRTEAIEQNQEAKALETMAKAIARHVHRETCAGGCRRRCVAQSTPGKYRAMVTVDAAIEFAVERDWIIVDVDHYRAGSSRPT